MTDTSSRRLPRAMLGGVLEVSAVGLGCMGMAEFYGRTDEAESIRTIHGALDLGMDFLDTAAMYGAGRSEEIVGKALAGGRRERVVLATKCGLVRTADGVRVDGRPEQIRRDIEESLRRLRTDRVDLYYLHRIDPQVPVEESVGAMAELVRAGKVRYLGLSEAGAATVKRGHAVHPITAVQSEYSLASRDPERQVLPTARELGIGFVAYSPFSRGLLSGEVTSRADLTDGDMRSGLPRFSAENLGTNRELVGKLAALAGEFGCTLPQLALAWLRAQDVVPIPGAKCQDHMAVNAAAAEVVLDAAQLARIEELLPVGAFAGERFPPHLLATVEQD
ncbi:MULTISPECIES: aldo/keto reductase [Streptomycetaceae]|uniref:aldo/keto reductase n=1 Tax=Streptomycetaceae TaxID=2062 RepID=UPI00300BAA49